MEEEIRDKEDVIETQNEGEKDKEDIIEDEVKEDIDMDAAIAEKIDRFFDRLDDFEKRIDKIDATVSGFVDYGGVISEGNDDIAKSPADDGKKFVPIEELDLRL